jgi:hypothetical protein
MMEIHAASRARAGVLMADEPTAALATFRPCRSVRSRAAGDIMTGDSWRV